MSGLGILCFLVIMSGNPIKNNTDSVYDKVTENNQPVQIPTGKTQKQIP